MGVEAVQEGAQPTALGGASAQRACGGEVWARSHSLGLVGQEVHYASTCEREEA